MIKFFFRILFTPLYWLIGGAERIFFAPWTSRSRMYRG
jgi:hypothetical protein